MSLFDAYLQYAWVIAVFHGTLLIICVGCFIAEHLRIMRERKAYDNLLSTGFAGKVTGATEMARLAGLTLAMARKGEIPSTEVIRARLNRHLARYDVIVRYCLNAFVISGLLGTLYNLWKLGPSFWTGIISGKEPGGQPAIGVAFSASVFGLALALSLSLLDSLLMRFRRENFLREASTALFDAAAEMIPPTERAAVAEAMQKFFSDSEGLLKEFRTQHEELSSQLIEQIRESSGALTATLDDVSSRWLTLIGNASDSVNSIGERLGQEAGKLAEATTKTDQTLGAALPLLREAEDLGTTLLQIRSQAEELQRRILSGISEFGEQWRADLETLTQSHTNRMEQSYSSSVTLFEEKAGRWHQQNADALTRFSGGIEKSLSEWSEERQRVAAQLDALIDSWRRELGSATTGVWTGLSTLSSEVEALRVASTQLATSQEATFVQLRELQIVVASFSATVINGTPLGEAVRGLNESVNEFKTMIVENNGKPPGDVSPPPDPALLQAIRQELINLSNTVSDYLRRPPPVTPESGRTGAGTTTEPTVFTLSQSPPRRSLWGKLTARFRKEE